MLMFYRMRDLNFLQKVKKQIFLRSPAHSWKYSEETTFPSKEKKWSYWSRTSCWKTIRCVHGTGRCGTLYAWIARTGDPIPHLLTADIIATGIGKPHFVKPEMIKEGRNNLDGGTSEKNEKIVGDADPSCAEKMQHLHAVPGGIGRSRWRCCLGI